MPKRLWLRRNLDPQVCVRMSVGAQQCSVCSSYLLWHTCNPMPSDKDGKDFLAALVDCPVLKKFYEANRKKDGSLNVDLGKMPDQMKALCAEFKSASSKCRTHAVVGKMFGSQCGGAGAKCVLRCFWQTPNVNIPSHPLSPRPRDPPNVRNVYSSCCWVKHLIGYMTFVS